MHVNIIYKGQADTSNVLEELESTVFSIFETFSKIDLPNSSWVSFDLNEMKILAQMELSSHLEPRPTVVKEIRLYKNHSEVDSLILGKQFAVSQNMISVIQLQTIVDDFHSLAICRGIPPIIAHNVVDTMKNGYINVINRWQSKECKLTIEKPNENICSKCCLLSRALSEKVVRYLYLCIK